MTEAKRLFRVKLRTSVESTVEVNAHAVSKDMAVESAVAFVRHGTLTWQTESVRPAKAHIDVAWVEEVRRNEPMYAAIADKFCKEFADDFTRVFAVSELRGAVYKLEFLPDSFEIVVTLEPANSARKLRITDVPKIDLRVAPEDLVNTLMIALNLEPAVVRSRLKNVFYPLANANGTVSFS